MIKKILKHFSKPFVNPFFNKSEISAYDAQYEAQKIAFAPIIFQAVRVMRDEGVLELLYEHRKTGINFEQIKLSSHLSSYGLKILLETGLSAKVVYLSNDNYFLSKIGYFLLKDEMTRINMDYTHYVNYEALFYLDKSIKQRKPLGLKKFGNWQTIYPGLTSLPKKVRDSWFNFDHYYSDSAFHDVLELLNKNNIRSILDVGGNTGKFSVYIAQHSDRINLTIVDLPEQIKVAEKHIIEQGLEHRIALHSGDVMDNSQQLPAQHDIIWMSQFLDCFSEDDITSIVKKASLSMTEKTELWIMEPLWDRQRHETSAYCIINTSPYFTCMANGYSKMYRSEDLILCIERAGLEIIEMIDDLGICQSILRCKLS